MAIRSRLQRFHTLRRGFSLIELVLVIGIIAVMCAMVQPRYSRMSNSYRLDLAARRIASDLTLAQTRARQKSASQSIAFSPVSNSYQLPGEAGMALKSQTYTVRLSDSPYSVSIGTVNFAGTATLTFNGFGVPDRPGSLTLTAGGVQRTVNVAAVSGSVTVQ